MTLIGIPIIFVLISTFEMSRGMWIYQTLSYAAREGTRYMAVHGVNCQTTPNACAVNQADLGRILGNATTGLTPGDVHVTFTSCSTPTTCADKIGYPPSVCTLTQLQAGTCTNSTTCTATLCGNNTCNYIPTCGGYVLATPISVQLTYPFHSAMSMFWPGAGRGFVFSPVTFTAISTDYIQF